MKQKFPILIVEDDLVSQRLLEKAFIHAGYEVTSAENGRKALECFDKTFFPIVVTDWIMPEMDGLELCRAIRKRTDKGYVFIILLTSKDSTGDIISGLESGADDYLTKPFSYDELIARLNTGIRILKLEDSLKGVEREIRRYNEHLEDMVAERTENLRKSEEKYRTILENIEDGYYEIDIAGNFIFFNDALCNITGYPGNELMGMNLSRLANQDNTRSGHQVFQEVYAKGVAIKDFNWEFTKMDGSARHAEASISLIRDREGKGTGFRGIIRDISKRKKLEHELIEKKRLAEEASKAKSEFLANISHEIRTPLNGIIGMAEWVMETDLNNDQRDIFHAINTEADSLLGIINDILDLCKIESGKLELEEIPFDLRALFEDMANSFAIRAEKKGLEFISFLSPDVPSQLIGDPGRLRQILLNLGDNALKFTHEGEIYIKGEVAEDFEHKVKLRFLVKDTGIGIPKEKQEIIFESFRQADGSTTRNYGGTGLGTTISKELAEMNGGEIFVESEEGKGSTFCFTAIYTKQKERKPILRKEEVNLSNLKALIVDDNEKNRFILTEYLNLWGCCSLTASGGREALSMLKNSVLNNEPVQLILTDLQMPEMDGFSLVIEIKKEKDLKDIPVIALDSLARRGNGKSCRDIGIAGYLTKPIKKDDLHKVIALVLTQKEQTLEPELITRHTIAEEYRRDFTILLVEDYPTNQQVAMRNLRSASYHVDLAENGMQAVKAFKQKHYDLILMDIQMPVMDGYNAAKEIRDLEGKYKKDSNRKIFEGSKRVPIIAMTAHVMKGDREKCLDAGMDDYISKPLRKKALLSMIEKWVTSKQESEKACELGLSESAEGDTPMNFQIALEEFEGDRDFLKEVLGGFIMNARSQARIINQAILDGNAGVIREEAHAIKGGAANLCADRLSGIALELENIGKSDVLKGGMDLLERLDKELNRLEIYVMSRYPEPIAPID